MFRRIAVFATIVLAGCGTESASQAPSDSNNVVNIGPGAGSVRPATLLASTVPVKLVVNSARDVYSEVGTYDGATDTVVAKTCTANADCNAFPGAQCYDGAVCSVKSTVTAPLYTLDTTNAALTGIQVPCDGGLYTIELYGARALTDAEIKDKTKLLALNEAHITKSFKMSTACATVDPLTDAAMAIWSSGGTPTDIDPTANLSLKFSPIYTGLNAVPYTVTLNGASYPWTVSSWSVSYGSQAAGTTPTISGAVATFPAPTAAEVTAAGASALTFTALVRLAGTLDLNVTASDATVTKHSWQYTMPSVMLAPTSSGNVGVP